MLYSSEFIATDLHDKLHVLHWTPPKEPKALVVYSHGYAGHAARYEQLAAIFARHDIQCIGCDLTGHGQSGGLKGYIPDFKYWVRDFDFVFKKARTEYGDIPVFVFGHSMGALVVTTYILNQNPDISGAIFSGIGLYVTESVPSILVKISSVVSAVFPKLKTTKLKVNLTAKNKDAVNRYTNDPLIYHGGIRARTGYTFMKAAQHALDHLHEFDKPVLLLHGGDDQLATPNGSTDMYDRVSSKDKTIQIKDGLYHEILNEVSGPEIIEEMAQWILHRC